MPSGTVTPVNLLGYPHVPVGQMNITQYLTRSGPWYSQDVLHPTWDQVEQAVRRLDRCLFPFIWLYTTPAADSDSDVPQFEVVGGDGAYVVVLRSDSSDHRGRILQNPSGGDDEIDVWISDQGASFAAPDVCPSLDEVMRVTRHFFDHGAPAPDTLWG